MKLIHNAAKSIAALLLVTFFSCESDQEVTVGGEVLPGSTVKFKEIVLNDVVNLEQVSTTRIQSNDLPYSRLGKTADALYELVLKPRVGSNLPPEDNDTLLYKFSSAKMILSYRLDGPTDTDIDVNTKSYSIKNNSLQKEGSLPVKVFLLNQRVLNLDPEEAIANVYYADGWQPKAENILALDRGDRVELGAGLIQSPTNEPFNVDTVGNSNVSNTALQLSKNIEDALGNSAFILDLKEGGKFQEHFGVESLTREKLLEKSGRSFQEAFKAFYLNVDGNEVDNVFEVLPNNTTSNAVISRVEVVFDLMDRNGNPVNQLDGNGVDTGVVRKHHAFFYLNNENIGLGEEVIRAQNINFITPLNIETGGSNDAADSVELKSGIGSIAKLKLFPKPQDVNGKSLLDSLFTEEDYNREGFNVKSVISKAVLRFIAKNTDGLPDALALNPYAKNANESTPGFLIDFNTANVSNETLFRDHLIKKTEVGDDVVYDIVVTEHLQQIFNQNELKEAEEQNSELSLSIYNEKEEVSLISGLKTTEEGNNEEKFYVFGGVLYSNDKIKISSKPKLIIKFTPTN